MKKILTLIFLIVLIYNTNSFAVTDIVYPTTASEGVKISVTQLADYLKKMGEKNVSLTQVNEYSYSKDPAEKIIILVQHPQCENIIGKKFIKQINFDGFAIGDRKIGNKRIIALWGDEPRGSQYAVYDLLQTLGVRFFHPQQEYIPSQLIFPTNLAKVENPDFKYRSYGLHTTHPVELINSFADCNTDISYAKNWVDWVIKNKANNAGVGARGGWLDEACYQKRSKEVSQYVQARGFLKTAGIAFGNYQQGGKFYDVDPTTGVPTKENVIKQLEQIFADKTQKFDMFGVHFGTSEFTMTDDIATVELFNTIARWMYENKPDIPMFINDHTSGGQITPHYKVEYYDLVQFAPTIMGIQVHTMFFYDLIGPAPYYGNIDVKYKYKMMLREAQKGRQLIYFPESAWWLSFDNDVPLYLPLTLKTRDNDIQLLKPLLQTVLKGHNLFTTGQEWGYWQIDWCVGQMQWNTDFRYTDCINEIAKPLGSSAADIVANVVKEMALDQEQEFIYKNKIKYLCGEDEIDEVGQMAGIEGHPLRIPFSKINKWSLEQIKKFRSQEIQPLKTMAEKYQKWIEQLNTVKDKIPNETKWIFDEIYDGTEIDLLRTNHIVALYEAVLTYRENILNKVKNDEPEKFFKLAEEITEKAKVVIHRREKGYRYPAEWSYGGGLTPETAVNNGTVYPYRVFTKTNLAFYWTRRNQQAKEFLEGKQEIIPVQPLLPLVNEKVNINISSIKGKNIQLQIGEQKPTNKKEFSLQPKNSAINILLKGEDISSVQWTVVPMKKLFSLPAEGLEILKPANPTVSQTVKQIFPTLLTGISADGKEIILSLDEDNNNDADSTEFTRFKNAKQTAEGWTADTATFTIYLTNPATGEKVSPIKILNINLVLKDKENLVELAGGISTEDVINTIMQLGGMDEKGTRGLIANLLNVPTNQLPESIPFVAKFKAVLINKH